MPSLPQVGSTVFQVWFSVFAIDSLRPHTEHIFSPSSLHVGSMVTTMVCAPVAGKTSLTPHFLHSFMPF